METVTSDLIKPFFVGDYPFTSLLNTFKDLIKKIPKENPKKSKKFINKLLNFIKFNNFLPLQLNSKDEISIETFNSFLYLRGLINKSNVNNKEAIIFIRSSYKNLYDQKFNVDPCKILMRENRLNEMQYSQYLQKDIHKEFISTCDAKNLFPLPIVIYDHFIHQPNFSFVSYCENETDPKILFNHSIFWIMNFFLYGLINDCKINGKSSNPINNIIYYIEKGMEIESPFFIVLLQESIEFNDFLYDHLFTQFCIKEENKEFISKFYFYNFLHKDPIFHDICSKYPIIYESLKIANPWPYDLNAFHLNEDEISPISIRSLLSYKKIFIEIPELESAIQPYEKWKNENIEMLANGNIFELIRTKLFQRNENIENFDDQFGQWLLNPNISLINREVYSTFKAIYKGEKEKINLQIQILKRILNPWNNDDRAFNFFIYNFLNSNSNFTSYAKFNKKVANGFSILIDIYRHCKPFYFCQKKEDDEMLTYILYEKSEVKTFYIERLLYFNTMFPTPSYSLGKDIFKKIFDFFCNLQFVCKTVDLCYLAAFANEIVKLFRDQLNLSFIFLTTTKNCIDLLDEKIFPLIQKVIDQFKNWNCLDQLREALKSADLYNKGQNASEKLKSYINKLIEINNKTILDRKVRPSKIHFRIFSMNNTHSNMSLMNTFVPALSHLSSKTLDQKKLISAYYLLTKSSNESKSDNKISIDIKTTLNSALPLVFDFRPDFTKSFAKTIMIQILPISMNENFLGFDNNKVALSLCYELHDHIRNNPDSYRTLIFNKINSSNSSDVDDDKKEMLNTLMALFEVFDENDQENHQFFSTHNWINKITPPDIINGAKLAYKFLDNYIIPSKV